QIAAARLPSRVTQVPMYVLPIGTATPIAATASATSLSVTGLAPGTYTLLTPGVNQIVNGYNTLFRAPVQVVTITAGTTTQATMASAVSSVGDRMSVVGLRGGAHA